MLIRALGEEAAAILACADSAAERMKAEAGITAQRVRQDLQGIGSSLVDVHQLLGELVSLVTGLTEGTALATVTESEATVPQPEPPAGDGTPAEVRTVLGEVLGLSGQSTEEIQLPEDSEVSGRRPLP